MSTLKKILLAATAVAMLATTLVESLPAQSAQAKHKMEATPTHADDPASAGYQAALNKMRGELAAAIQVIRGSGVPLIVVDQDIAFLGELIDTLYLFDHGRISRRIEKADMPTHEEIMKLMFGEDHH